MIAAAACHPRTQLLFNIEMEIALDIHSACLELARFLNGSGSETDVFGVSEKFASRLTRSFKDLLFGCRSSTPVQYVQHLIEQLWTVLQAVNRTHLSQV